MRHDPHSSSTGMAGGGSGNPPASRPGPFPLSPQRVPSLLLSILLFASFLQGWMNPGPTASASSRPHSTPPSFTFQQYLNKGPQHIAVKSGAPSPYPQPPKHTTNTGANPIAPPPSAEPPTMKPLSQLLSSTMLAGSTGGSVLGLKGSDGRLEVQVQPGSLDLSQATIASGKTPSGSLTLQITQLHGHFEGMLNTLGTYQVQVVDSQGQVVHGITLRIPVTIIYHYHPPELLSLNLDPAHIVLSWPTLIAAARQAKQPTANLAVTMHNNTTTHTLSAQSLVLGPGPFSLTNDGQNQMAPVPHLAEVQGNNGQLSYGYPLQVVPGSGGFTPQLTLAYSSLDPNDRHSNTSATSDVGDGFSLSLGSITANYYPTSGATWYFINGIGNVGDRLIQYDSTNKLYYTEHLSYLRVQQLTSTITNQSCFNVWDKSGTFYEVGCTQDSLEYSMVGTTRSNYQWNVDRIIAPSQGPQGSASKGWRLMLISYLQDCGASSTTQPCPSGTTIRDAVIKQITYGYNTSYGALTTLDGTAGTIDFTYLAPFTYSQNGVTWATTYTYGPGGNDPCANPPVTPTLRCDDPIQETGSGSYFTAPDVLGTFSLATITSYLNTDSSANAAYGYALSYSDSPFRSCTDPASGLSGYCAGEHLLSRITPRIYQSGTAHPLQATTFSYSPAYGQAGALTDTYYDGSQSLTTSTSWQYLTAYQDLNTGAGETMTYALAYNNTDGTPTIKNGTIVTDDRYDALYCSTNANNSNTSLRCTGIYGHPDDRAWSVQVVTSITSSGKDSSALSTATTTFNYYRLANTYPYTHQSGSTSCQPDQYAQEQDCVGDNWLASGDSDWADYYHTEFRGFNQVWQLSPAGDLTVDYYFSTEGWSQPATDPANYDGGQLLEEDRYQGGTYSASTLVQKTVDIYPGPYPHTSPSNSTSNPTACYTPSGSSPYAACDVMQLSSTTTDYEETNSSSAPWVEHDYTYDDYDTTNGLKSGYHNLSQEVIKGSNLPNAAPNLVYPLTEKWSYAINNTPGNWTHYIVDPVSHSEIDDANGHIWQCQYTSFDEGNTMLSAGWPTTMQTFSSGNCAGKTSPLTTTYQGYDAYGNLVASVDGVGAATPTLYTSNGCTVTTGTIEIANSAWTAGRYTSCASYDSGHYEALPTSGSNAFSQATSYTYDATQGNALSQSQDPNSQTTSYSYSYDGSGNRTVQVTLPPDSSHYTTQATSYATCTGSSTLPCYEVDKLSYQYNTVLASTFYDGQGRAVETSTPGPAPSNPIAGDAYYTIVFTSYNDSNHSTFQSEPFVVAVPTTQHGSGYIDPNGAKDYLGNTPGGTATFYDALGRVLAVRDPSYGSSGEPGIACSTILSGTYTGCTNYTVGQVSGDSNYYTSATSIDPNKHLGVSYLDALGRTVYTQQDSGIYGGTPTANAQTTIVYNALDKPTSVQVKDLSPQSGESTTTVTTTAQYDDLGRLTQLADPDRGTHTYSYDANGKVTSDVSGSPTRTIGYVYDLLGRLGCVQDASPSYSPTGACSGGNAYVQNTYDTNKLTISGTTDYPVGQLTQSVSTTYFSGSAASVTQTYEHDARGRSIGQQLQFSLPSSWNVTTALPTYQAQYSYNDADQLTTTTTSTIPTGQGFTTTQVYDSTTGVKTGLSNNSTATANLATLSYSSQAQLASLNFLTNSSGALASDALGYDGNLRLQSIAASWQGGSGHSGTIFSQNLTYDPAGNLISLATTQDAVGSSAGGSETANFCYDEQNRQVWAGNTGTQPAAGNGTCGSATLASGLSGAAYNSTYAYTHLGQLWQGPLSGGGEYQYLYCSSSQPHQLTGLYATGSTCASKTGQVYTSSYDNWGNVTGRSFSGTTGTLSYDILDHLTQWYASSSNQEQYLYDASGERVLRRFTTGSSTTILTYPFGIEEHQYSGAGSNQWNIYYYFLAGRLLGSLDGNGTQFYLSDAQGSLVSAFTNAQGGASMKSNQLFGPYGNGRYYACCLNTAKGFVGQYNDGTGLDYFHARYYDPVVGVFLSADTQQGNPQGMNPYAYVKGNPETYSDPTGRYVAGPVGSGVTYYPGSPYYMQGGVAYQVGTLTHPVPDGTPYTGGAFANGRISTAVPQSTGHTGAKSVVVNPAQRCDPACVARDENMIKGLQIKEQAAQRASHGDFAQLAGDVIAVLADIFTQNWSALVFDIIQRCPERLSQVID